MALNIKDNSTVHSCPKPVVVAENITKYYPLNPQLVKIRGESLFTYLKKLIIPGNAKQFLALNNVSFIVNRGETVGIVGANGAGKSTLLRILTGISRPTEGTVKVDGKYSELFALNAGFNMELSGRKNIYLYAAMKNIPLSEIEEKMEYIIQFSGIREFIDEPVKRYSNGMRGRLGFSILFNTLPEIIFIDEALSVGDARFQEKCMESLLRFKEEKRTLIIVSHSQGMMRRLCTRLLWLDKGELIMDGQVEDVLKEYRSRMQKTP